MSFSCTGDQLVSAGIQMVVRHASNDHLSPLSLIVVETHDTFVEFRANTPFSPRVCVKSKGEPGTYIIPAHRLSPIVAAAKKDIPLEFVFHEDRIHARAGALSADIPLIYTHTVLPSLINRDIPVLGGNEKVVADFASTMQALHTQSKCGDIITLCAGDHDLTVSTHMTRRHTLTTAPLMSRVGRAEMSISIPAREGARLSSALNKHVDTASPDVAVTFNPGAVTFTITGDVDSSLKEIVYTAMAVPGYKPADLPEFRAHQAPSWTMQAKDLSRAASSCAAVGGVVASVDSRSQAHVAISSPVEGGGRVACSIVKSGLITPSYVDVSAEHVTRVLKAYGAQETIKATVNTDVEGHAWMIVEPVSDDDEGGYGGGSTTSWIAAES